MQNSDQRRLSSNEISSRLENRSLGDHQIGRNHFSDKETADFKVVLDGVRCTRGMLQRLNASTPESFWWRRNIRDPRLGSDKEIRK